MWRTPYMHEFPFSKEIGKDIMSTQVWEKKGLFIGVRTLPLLKSRHKNRLIHMLRDLYRFGS
jgi:hypothetical protein